jgi:MoaA/NifB/PqqE/SkfB family radical SAM enzyme
MCDYRLNAFGRKELKLEQIKQLIEDAAEMGVERLDLSGGEPMVRKDVYEIISLANSFNISTLLVTNGTLIGETEAQKLVDSGLKSVIISLEGFEETNDLVRGQGSFRKAVAAIRELKKYRDKLEFINVGITVSKVNYKELYDFTRFLFEEIGVDAISYNPFDKEMLCSESYKDVKDIFCVSKDMLDDLSKELERIIEYSKTNNRRVSPEKYLRKIPLYFAGEKILPNVPCYEPFVGCAINCSGEVFSCWGEHEEVGNINEDSLKDIVNSIEYKAMCEKAYSLKCKGCLKACYVGVHVQ